jgi:hypothetical protein
MINSGQPLPEIQVLDTLFGGSTPRLSSLKLHKCNISWNSPLLNGLKYLEILSPYEMARPTLAVWLDTLDAMPQLEMLTLNEASPVAVHFPFDVERTVTLPSLTHLEISASLRDCALASAHLVLPVLTSLSVAINTSTNGSGVQEFFPYVARHVHGPQDIRPLQSVLIRNYAVDHLQLLAWSVPDIDTWVHDPPAFLGATLPTRVNLSFRKCKAGTLTFEKMMVALPLDGLLTLATVDLCEYTGRPSRFWLRLLPNWPLLRRVRLGHWFMQHDMPSHGFIKALLKDDGGSKNPLLPSLTELSLHGAVLDDRALCLRDALMKRVEQGVPLEMLDLRMCDTCPYTPVAVQLLSEIVADVLCPLDFLGPEDTKESRDAGLVMLEKMRTMWSPLLPQSPYAFSKYDNRPVDDGDDY